MNQRKSGILLHISSLPSSFGIGDLGPGAYRFIDFLVSAKQQYWQILPLNPTDPVYGNSPYSSNSAYGLNCLFISPELLKEDGLCDKEDLTAGNLFNGRWTDYEEVSSWKNNLFDLAYKIFKNKKILNKEFQKFVSDHADWVNDYALFVVLKKHFNHQLFSSWPAEFKRKEVKALADFERQAQDQIEKIKFIQFLFYRQWQALKAYGNKKGVKIVGDIPIYVGEDSVDVWQNPEMFKLDKDLTPQVVAGVPPDYFSKTGQRWGNPVYNWDKLKQTQFSWWIKRLKHNLNLCDVIRIDHFRAFINYWEIPKEEETAINGYWVKTPTKEFFTALHPYINFDNVIAEDLGMLEDWVRKEIDDLAFPVMKILLFAFNGNLEDHIYLPHNYPQNCVVYTGTHDNNTVMGWFDHEATPHEKKNLKMYYKKYIQQEQGKIHWNMIELAFKSPARIAIIPMQDVLGLSKVARMNIPGTTQDNWRWRLLPEQMSPSLAKELADLTTTYDRF